MALWGQWTKWKFVFLIIIFLFWFLLLFCDDNCTVKDLGKGGDMLYVCHSSWGQARQTNRGDHS